MWAYIYVGGLQIEFLPPPYEFVVEKAVFDEFYLFIYLWTPEICFRYSGFVEEISIRWNLFCTFLIY